MRRQKDLKDLKGEEDMKKIVVVALMVTGLVMGVSVRSFASDWDKAGKALAVIEGLRIITGGRADVIGTVTGINRPAEQARENGRGYAYGRRDRDDRPGYYTHDNRRSMRECERVWVPHYVWREKFVPRHTEYRSGYGRVVIEAHYERYQAENGGHWEWINNHQYSCK
jgi:hypothetical protein